MVAEEVPASVRDVIAEKGAPAKHGMVSLVGLECLRITTLLQKEKHSNAMRAQAENYKIKLDESLLVTLAVAHWEYAESNPHCGNYSRAALHCLDLLDISSGSFAAFLIACEASAYSYQWLCIGLASSSMQQKAGIPTVLTCQQQLAPFAHSNFVYWVLKCCSSWFQPNFVLHCRRGNCRLDTYRSEESGASRAEDGSDDQRNLGYLQR